MWNYGCKTLRRIISKLICNIRSKTLLWNKIQQKKNENHFKAWYFKKRIYISLPVDSSARNISFTFEEEGETDKATVKQVIATACKKTKV